MMQSPEFKAQALILCGGFGTRLGGGRAKALLDIGGQPVLDYFVGQLLELGIERVAIVTNERDRADFDEWSNSREYELAVSVYSNGCETSEQRLGAVGDLAFLFDRVVVEEGALVAAGDNIFEFSLAPFWRHFQLHSASLVLAVPDRRSSNLQRTGVLRLDARQRVLELQEKPEQPISCWTCPPIYALLASDLLMVRSYLDEGLPRDEIGRFAAYLAERNGLWAFPVAGSRVDIGNRESLEQARLVVTPELPLAPGDRLSEEQIAQIAAWSPT